MLWGYCLLIVVLLVDSLLVCIDCMILLLRFWLDDWWLVICFWFKVAIIWYYSLYLIVLCLLGWTVFIGYALVFVSIICFVVRRWVFVCCLWVRLCWFLWLIWVDFDLCFGLVFRAFGMVLTVVLLCLWYDYVACFL